MAAKKVTAQSSTPAFLQTVERNYAMIMCRASGNERIKIYRKLMSLMKNRFSLMNALERLWSMYSKDGKSPGEPFALTIHYWLKSLQAGETFSIALKGWAPARERLMLSVGDVSHLDDALENVIKVAEGTTRMVAPLTNALGYPSFLICLTCLIIYAIGVYMVPPLQNAAPNVRWTGLAAQLVWLSKFVEEYWFVVFGSLPIFFGTIFFTLSLWKGKSRAYFDGFPPWSLYRVFTGVGWLLAFAALIKAGTPVSAAMRSLRADASPYLLERIDKALVFVNAGDNLGEALHKTGYGFPDPEIVGDLRVYSELDNFQAALEQMANEWLESSVTSIEQKASLLNMVALLGVVGVIGWAVMGTFEMQGQITSGMGVT